MAKKKKNPIVDDDNNNSEVGVPLPPKKWLSNAALLKVQSDVIRQLASEKSCLLGCQLLPYLLSAASQLATDVHNEFLIHSFNLNIGLLIAKVRI